MTTKDTPQLPIYLQSSKPSNHSKKTERSGYPTPRDGEYLNGIMRCTTRASDAQGIRCQLHPPMEYPLQIRVPVSHAAGCALRPRRAQVDSNTRHSSPPFRYTAHTISVASSSRDRISAKTMLQSTPLFSTLFFPSRHIICPMSQPYIPI